MGLHLSKLYFISLSASREKLPSLAPIFKLLVVGLYKTIIGLNCLIRSLFHGDIGLLYGTVNADGCTTTLAALVKAGLLVLANVLTSTVLSIPVATNWCPNELA